MTISPKLHLKYYLWSTESVVLYPLPSSFAGINCFLGSAVESANTIGLLISRLLWFISGHMYTYWFQSYIQAIFNCQCAMLSCIAFLFIRAIHYNGFQRTNLCFFPRLISNPWLADKIREIIALKLKSILFKIKKDCQIKQIVVEAYGIQSQAQWRWSQPFCCAYWLSARPMDSVSAQSRN